MPLSRWFRGGAPTLRDRVVKGLQQARDGDVDGAIATIAERFSDALEELLALYEGATVLEHGLPERIVLYQRNHENVVSDDRELAEEVRETMRHEVGHHFGMAEDELPY